MDKGTSPHRRSDSRIHGGLRSPCRCPCFQGNQNQAPRSASPHSAAKQTEEVRQECKMATSFCKGITDKGKKK